MTYQRDPNSRDPVVDDPVVHDDVMINPKRPAESWGMMPVALGVVFLLLVGLFLVTSMSRERPLPTTPRADAPISATPPPITTAPPGPINSTPPVTTPQKQ